MKPGTGVTRFLHYAGRLTISRGATASEIASNTYSSLYRTPDLVQPLIPHARQQSRNREPPLLRTERFKPDRLAHSLPLLPMCPVSRVTHVPG